MKRLLTFGLLIASANVFADSCLIGSLSISGIDSDRDNLQELLIQAEDQLRNKGYILEKDGNAIDSRSMKVTLRTPFMPRQNQQTTAGSPAYKELFDMIQLKTSPLVMTPKIQLSNNQGQADVFMYEEGSKRTSSRKILKTLIGKIPDCE